MGINQMVTSSTMFVETTESSSKRIGSGW